MGYVLTVLALGVVGTAVAVGLGILVTAVMAYRGQS